MRILLASSEVHPYSKTGGLADMVGALAKTLARTGHTVGLVTPLYLGIRERFPELRRLELPLDVPLGTQRVEGEVWSLEPTVGLTVYFIEQPGFFQRSTLYQKHGVDYPDNAERFIFFSKAVAHLALHLPWKPELVHVHDWQTSLVPLLLAHERRLPEWRAAPRTCLTVHNLAYQGVFSAAKYALTNLPWDYFNPEAAEFYGQVDCLKAGIALADIITTVSPRYAREITTEQYGCGLEGLLRRRQNTLLGILNGVDYDEWKTTGNRFLKRDYYVSDLNGKIANKLDLQRECGLPEDAHIPLFGNIGRMVEQKGIDIMLGALEEMLSANLQFVLLGSGPALFEQAYQDLARRYQSKAAVRIGYDEGLAHRIEAGSDFFLMPSRFEPCGLNQMYSLRYGAVPVVRQTGGLDDTVVDVREDEFKADGIKFTEYSSQALAKGIQKALALYQESELLHRFRMNGMTTDFSWERTVSEYVKAYQMATALNR
jgi:starch synthase